jgi:hypothetical protein
MTPLFASSFAAVAVLTDERSMALPLALGGRDKSAFGMSSTPLEILTTCALLEGTKTRISRTETARAARILPACLFI